MPDTTLLGRYKPPDVKIGERVWCKRQRRHVVVTGWSNSRIKWPMARPGPFGKPSLIVTQELSRAIKTESSAALQHWLGVSISIVWTWRRIFRIGAIDTPGSRRLHQAKVAKSVARTKGRKVGKMRLSPAQRLKFVMNGQYVANRIINSGRCIDPSKQLWTVPQIALLGTAPDAELAEWFGRTSKAVRHKREDMAIPAYRAK